MASGAPAMGARERRKQRTRSEIQRQALALFLRDGYDATTVQDVCDAAGVSHMTFFRYFPTKEDVVVSDAHDDVIALAVREQPAGAPAVARIENGVVAALAGVSAGEQELVLARTKLILATPPLRARLWEQHAALADLLVAELADGESPGRSDDAERLQVVAAACVSAMSSAIRQWADGDGAQDLSALLRRAFAILREELAA